MNMNEKQMEQDFKKFVGALFGIDTDNLDVNVQKTENGTTISASTKTEESSDEAKNLSQSLKNKLDKFGFDTTKKDELVNNLVLLLMYWTKPLHLLIQLQKVLRKSVLQLNLQTRKRILQ